MQKNITLSLSFTPARALSASFLVLALSTGTSAQFTIQDISPDQSTLDPRDPDGASGGRVNGLATVAGDNNTFYAASEWGGIYKSTDGGLTWTRLNSHLPTVTWDVEVDPSFTSRVYATSFYDGRRNPLSGINVSEDGGMSWTRPATATPPLGFNCAGARRAEPSAFGISIDPANPQNVYIGTNCGLAVSNDSGVSWTFIDPTPSTSASNIWDVVVHNGGIIDVCGDDGHLRSTSGGMSWSGSGLPSGVCSIAVSPDESYVLLATVGTNIYESDNGGQSWTNLGTPEAARQGRIPFVETNQRANASGQDRFDLWFGDVRLYRGTCVTPSPKAMGGSPRCPMGSLANDPPDTPPANWAGPFTRSRGAHDDVGSIVFDSQASVDACPMIFSSDGGVYYNTDTSSPGCHTPSWEQPNVTPHGLWLWSIAGAHQAGESNEDLYFGLQDNGSFGATNGGAALPSWTNRDCCDVFDTVAEPTQVVYTFCCTGPRATILVRRGSGLSGGGGLSDPADYPADGLLPGFLYPDILDRFGTNQYVIITRDCQGPNGIDDDGDGNIDDANELAGCTGVNNGDGGIYITSNMNGNPVNWTELGPATEPPTGGGGACAVKAAVSGGTPTFYVQTGRCDGLGNDQLWRFVGTNPAGSWIPVSLPPGGLSIFDVDPNNPNRLILSNPRASGAEIRISTNGGASWDPLPELDNLMDGGGVFRARNNLGPTDFTSFFGYPQPSMLEFDPEDSNVIVAGGRDSGVFLSTDGGEDWTLVSDPFNSGNSGVPHIPRPWFAYFDHEPSNEINIYVGTQGRGVWRINLLRPPVADADGPYTTNEGTDILLDASGSSDKDPGALSFDWDLDNDGLFDDSSIAMPLFTMVGQDGVFPVAVRVIDADGASDTDESTVRVNNVAPSINSISTNAPQPEGGTVSLVGTASDPGWLDPLTANVLWADGSPLQALPGLVENNRPDATISFGGNHLYLDNLPANAPYNVRVCVRDDDTETCQFEPVVIFNVPPTVTAAADQVIFEDDPLGLPVLATFTDPGVLDTHTATIHWGDGTPIEPGTVNEVNGSGDVSGEHVYPTPGVYTVTVTVTDKDGGVHADSFLVTVVHGFLRYCLFSEDASSTSSLALFQSAQALCSVGSNGGIQLGPSTQVRDNLLTVEHSVDVSPSAVVGGNLTAEMSLTLGNGARVSGNVLLGGSATLKNAASIGGDLTVGGGVSLGPKAGVAGTVTEGASVPSVPDISSLVLALSAGTTDVSVRRGEVRNLAPGSYGALRLMNDAAVVLRSGFYEFTHVDLGPGSRVALDLTGGPVVVDVVGNFIARPRVTMSIQSPMGDEEDVMFRVQGPKVVLDTDGQFLGTFLALGSEVQLLTDVRVRGAVYGRTLAGHTRLIAEGEPALDLFISLFLAP